MPKGVYDRSPEVIEKMRSLKPGTRQQVAQVRVNNPRATLQEIGDNFCISRERVRQILKEEGLPTAAEVDRILKFCKTCGKKLKPVNKTGYCQQHLRDGITHCPQGHPYNEENTYIDKRGLRACRACARDYKRAYYADNHERLLAYSRRYQADHREAVKAWVGRYREKHRDKCQDCGGPCAQEAKRCRACWLNHVRRQETVSV